MHWGETPLPVIVVDWAVRINPKRDRPNLHGRKAIRENAPPPCVGKLGATYPFMAGIWLRILNSTLK